MGPKKTNIQRLLECRIKSKTQHQRPKDAKLHALQNNYFGFSIYWFLTPKNQSLDFSKNNCGQNQNSDELEGLFCHDNVEICLKKTAQ